MSGDVRGPWGTTRAQERAYGYPGPRRDRIGDLERRIAQLEEQLAGVLERLATVEQTAGDAYLEAERARAGL